MNLSPILRAGLLACVLAASLQPVTACAQSPVRPAGPSAPRDGQHDFDFNIGAWKTHVSRRLHPLTGSDTWVQYDGTHIVKKVWNGRANLGVLEIDGTAGHIEALSLRLYHPQSHQWSLNFARPGAGRLGVPMDGEFRDGRGVFIDQEEIDGRTILVRNVWSDITPDSCRSEWSYSADGGKTWEVNWIAVDTRIPDAPVKAP